MKAEKGQKDKILAVYSYWNFIFGLIDLYLLS